MDVLSVSKLRTASLIWQPRPESFVLTVVCKATYTLAPVTSELAPDQEYPNEDENHWNDDPARSVYSPNDLVPLKPRAEVLLVGHAFAPRGDRARSLMARMIVGEVDKSVEVFADRSFALDGSLREGPPFTRVPLRYERAAGGPDTTNPVGVRPDARDTYGVLALPNLQPPGLSVTSPGDFIAPIGFGPIASVWASRREKLGPFAGRWSERALAAEPLPDQIDRSYFMAAPRDQQLAALRPDERIVLEHLHVDHPRLVTSLPGVEPRAFVERPGAPAQELPLVPDTLWIDTDRSLCTLTWRGQLAIEHPAARGRVLVGTAKVGRPLSWSEVEAEWRRARASSPSMDAAELLADEEGPTPLPAQSDEGPRRAATLPFVSARPVRQGEAVAPVTSAEAELSSAPHRPRANTVTMVGPSVASVSGRADSPFPQPRPTKDPRLGQTIDTVLGDSVVERAVAAAAADRAQRLASSPPPPGEATGDASPAWLRAPRPSAPQIPVTPPQRIAFGPPPATGADLARADAPLASAISAPMAPPIPDPAYPPAPLPVRFGPPPPLAMEPPPVKMGGDPPFPPVQALKMGGVRPPPPVWADAAKLGAAAASDAAAAKAESPTANAAGSGAEPAPARPLTRPREMLDLLWFEPSLPRRLRGIAAFRDRLAPRAGPDAWIRGELPARDAQAEQAERDRRDVLRVIGSEPFDASRIDRAVEEACDEEGAYLPPLVVVAGDLALSFDEREALRATVTCVAPLMGADKKLRDLVTEATDALKGEWPLPDDVAEGFTRRVEQAFAQSVRSVPPGYLQSSVDKLLLDGRHYRKKSVFSEARIRAELAGVGGEPIPAYLPVTLSMRLPLFSQFRSVMIVELRTQEDQHETHSQSLLVLAVARVIERRRSP